MSRSHRKTPIFGNTACRSERDDKKRWHKNWRAKERVAQALLSRDRLDEHMPLPENSVGNVWTMGKDGRAYWSATDRAAMAKDVARRTGRSSKEWDALQKRMLHKWMGK